MSDILVSVAWSSTDQPELESSEFSVSQVIASCSKLINYSFIKYYLNVKNYLNGLVLVGDVGALYVSSFEAHLL